MNKKVLVAYASKYGATGEIAEKIGEILNQAGLQTDVFPVKQVKDLALYGVVILGSAVYYGRWRKGAVKFLKKNEAAIIEMVPIKKLCMEKYTEFPEKVQLVMVGLLLSTLYIPPPSFAAVFPVKLQFVTMELLPVVLYIPPPANDCAVFLEKLQSVTVGLLKSLNIPPPEDAQLSLNVQFVIVGLLLL